MKFETKAIHAMKNEDENLDRLESVINLTAAFQLKKYKQDQEFEYSRVSTPTRSELERVMAKLENGEYAYAFVSGMAATASILSMFKAGDHIILGEDVYGGTYRIVSDVMKKFNLEYTFVDTTDLDKIEKAVRENTVAIFIETPSNPMFDVTDIRKVSNLSKKHNILTIIDNTFMTPYLQRPLELGADIVVHSATKFLGGHNDVLAGIVVVNDALLAEKIQFSQKAIGAGLPAFDSWLLTRSIKTLKVRMEAAQENTLKLIEFFKSRPEIGKIYFPTEDTNKGKEIHESQASGGGAAFSFIMKDENKIESFLDNLKLVTFAASLGGVETLVTHPCTITHAVIPEEERNARGLTENLVRVAVGIENIDDLIEDFKNALDK